MKLLIIFACAVAAVSAKAADLGLDLPSFVKLCRLHDLKRDVCIKDSIQNLLPEVKNNPNFFIPMDPFFYDTFNGQLKNSLIEGKYSVKNLKTLGMSNAVVKDVKSEFNDFGMKLELDLFFPKLLTSGFLKTNFFLSGVKVLSKGQFNITLLNVNNKWTMKGKLVNAGGEKFMEIYDTDIEMDIGDSKVAFSGAFEDPTLNDFLNNFINRYWRLVYKDLMAESKTQWSPMILEIINKFFSVYPYRKLFTTQ